MRKNVTQRTITCCLAALLEGVLKPIRVALRPRSQLAFGCGHAASLLGLLLFVAISEPLHADDATPLLWNGGKPNPEMADHVSSPVPPPRPVTDPADFVEACTDDDAASSTTLTHKELRTVSQADELAPMLDIPVPGDDRRPRVDAIENQDSGTTVIPEPVVSTPMQKLDIFRPVRQTTLAASVRLNHTDTEPLRLPDDQAGEIFAGFGRYHDDATYRGDGTTARCDYPIYFQPLYFEDPNLERCGRGCGCLTEAVSIVNFFGRIPIAPYLIGSQPYGECVRSLGDCPVCHKYGRDAYIPPLNARGVAFQAVAVVGLVFMLP